MTLLEGIKKYRLATTERLRIDLPTNSCDKASAKKWMETIQKFLTDHNLDDAEISIELCGHDGYLESVSMEAEVKRSDESIREHIDRLVEREKENKREYRERVKRRNQEERATYERLKKKFEKT
jgi:ATP-dependent protease HslVU (ClpYQ) ATPase subunit